MVQSSPFVVVLGVLCIILIPIVLLGNIFVIDVVRRHAHIRTIPNICTASLAVADLFVGLINIPLYIYAIYLFWCDLNLASHFHQHGEMLCYRVPNETKTFRKR